MFRKMMFAVGLSVGMYAIAMAQMQNAPYAQGYDGTAAGSSRFDSRSAIENQQQQSPQAWFGSKRLGPVTKRVTGHGYTRHAVPAGQATHYGRPRPLVRNLTTSARPIPVQQQPAAVRKQRSASNQPTHTRLAAHFDSDSNETDAQSNTVTEPIISRGLNAANRLKAIRSAKILGAVPEESEPEAAAQVAPEQQPSEADQPSPAHEPDVASASEPNRAPPSNMIRSEPIEPEPAAGTRWKIAPSNVSDEPGVPGSLPSVVRRNPAAQVQQPPRTIPIETAAKPATPVAQEPVPATSAASGLRSEGEGVLFSSRSPAISVETSGPRTIVVGKPAEYTVIVRNSGERDAVDVAVSIGLPSWAEVVDNVPTFGTARVEPDENETSAVKWHLPRLARRGSQKVALRIIPRDSRPFDLSVGWTFTPEKSLAHIQVQEPKLEMNIVGPQDIQFGETKIYTITLRNPGTGDAENVMLELLPIVPGEKIAGMREVGVLPAGSSKVIEVELAARQAGKLSVRGQATADGGLRAESTQEVIVRRANLEVVVEGPPMKYASTAAAYTIRIANSGDAAAENVVAAAMLPAGAMFVTGKEGGRFDESRGRVEWPIGILRPGAVRELQLQCVLESPGANRLEVQTRADGDISATQSIITAVESLADLKLHVNDPQGAVAVGADSVYEVKIVNRGTKAAENISIAGYFSEGIEPMTIEGWRGDIASGQVMMERIARLGPGQEMMFSITSRADRPGNHVFRVELECTNPETRLATEEWTRFYGDVEPIRQATRQPPQALQPAPPQRLEVR